MSNNEEMFVKINIASIQNGLIGVIGSDAWATLTALSTFSNERGECFPSQAVLAEILGLTRPTVNRRIAKLCSLQLEDGTPLVEKKLLNYGMGTRAFYKIHPSLGIGFGNAKLGTFKREKVTEVTEVTETEVVTELESNVQIDFTQDMTSADVVKYFEIKYAEAYSMKYPVNYRKECSMVKRKLLKTYAPQRIQAIIDKAIECYDERFATPKYTHPTIGQLCTWLAPKIDTLLNMEVEKERTERIEYEELSKFERSDYTEQLLAKAFGDLG